MRLGRKGILNMLLMGVQIRIDIKEDSMTCIKLSRNRSTILPSYPILQYVSEEIISLYKEGFALSHLLQHYLQWEGKEIKLEKEENVVYWVIEYYSTVKKNEILLIATI